MHKEHSSQPLPSHVTGQGTMGSTFGRFPDKSTSLIAWQGGALYLFLWKLDHGFGWGWTLLRSASWWPSSGWWRWGAQVRWTTFLRVQEVKLPQCTLQLENIMGQLEGDTTTKGWMLLGNTEIFPCVNQPPPIDRHRVLSRHCHSS
jgi:hypothetical protein